jgi:hypothetical protein
MVQHRAIMRSVAVADDFLCGVGLTACQQFITELGPKFPAIYRQVNAHGAGVQTAGAAMADTRGPPPTPSPVGEDPHHNSTTSKEYQ